MGFKRPFDEEEFQEFQFKHPRQLDCGNKLTSFAEFFPCYEAPQKDDAPDLVDKEFGISAPFLWTTNSTKEDDAGFGAAVHSSLSPEYFEFSFPRRSLVHFEDSYSSLLDSSPRKQIPIGQNHQAKVPEWDLQVAKKYSLVSEDLGDDDNNGEKLMGDCLIPMPEEKLLVDQGFNPGDGTTECSCLDGGSVRCVRQHVKEAREKIRETLGHKKFVELGFYDMGEEVAQKWTIEEEQVFHDVVYSNPVSVGKNFWEHLSVVFPCRTKKELVNYYFNVFMLRRRAVQNRSNSLDIDSDDDEWQGGDVEPVGVTEEDDDSSIEFFVDQDVQLDHDDDSPDDDDGDNNEDDCDGDVGNVGEETTGQNGGKSHKSKAQAGILLDDCRFDLLVHHEDKISGSVREDFDIQDDLCMYFECQPSMVDSGGIVDTRVAKQGSGITSDHRKGLHGNGDGLDPMDDIDLLPTSNMIEEIFGSCNWCSDSSNAKC